jgi:hypothetical protein
MAMGEWTLVLREGQVGRMAALWGPGLNLLPGIGVIPHYDRFGQERTQARVDDAPMGMVVLGSDEDTVILRVNSVARVLGRGSEKRARVLDWCPGQFGARTVPSS